MCGHLAFFDTEQMYERFDVKKPSRPLKDSYDVYPGQETPVIFHDGENKVGVKQFGFDLKWSKEPIFNAKVETIADRPTFSRKFREGRCLVPATKYFEWAGTKGSKTEYGHELGDGELFAMAAVCDKDSFAIITTEPWKKLQKIHHRMPVVMQREFEDDWLNPDIVEPNKLIELLEPVSAATISVEKV